MGVVRKNVRFHDDDPADMEIYHAVCNFRSYGFRSESHMIIESLRAYLSNNILSLSPEQLSDMIAEKVTEKINIVSVSVSGTSNDGSETELSIAEKSSDDEAYDAALNFIDSL